MNVVNVYSGQSLHIFFIFPIEFILGFTFGTSPGIIWYSMIGQLIKYDKYLIYVPTTTKWAAYCSFLAAVAY